MKKALLLAVAVVTLAAVKAADALEYGNFTDPTQVNLLERWNPGGTYYYSESYNTGNSASRAEYYKGAASGMYYWNLASLPTGAIGTFTFDTPKTLGQLMLQWRDVNHTPTSWTLSDQNGVIASDVRDPFPPTLRTYAVGARPASTYLQLQTSNVSLNNFIDLPRIGAYLPTGSSLAIDGTLNIFREEVPKGLMTVATSRPSMEEANLTNAQIDGFNCGPAGWIEWTMSQSYRYTGAFIAKFEDNDNVKVQNLKFEVYDGASWVTVFSPTSVNTGYLVFNQEATGNLVRMSWTDTDWGGGREVTELQLFGALEIPEPASLALLALGAFTLLRRKRS